MSNTKILKIKLQPIDYFFFGGEDTFGSHKDNYFVKSNQFPQQTSLLGVLRYLLVMEEKAIGESFQYNKTTNDYGLIKALSPVFLEIKNKAYIPVPYVDKDDKDHILEFEEKEHHFLFDAFKDETFKPVKCLKGYSEKGGINYQYYHDINVKLEEEKIFKSITKPGIDAKAKGVADEKGYFKQTYFKFKEFDTSFTFFAEIEIEDKAIFNNQMVSIGAEQSAFKMTAEIVKQDKVETAFNNTINHPITLENSILLTTDAYVDASIYDHCTISITGTKPFRNIITPKEMSKDDNYSDLSKNTNTNKRYKSVGLTLLKRGSILCSTDIEKTKTALDKVKNFKQIGYNYYKI